VSTRRDNFHKRCPKCNINPVLCFCTDVPEISNHNFVSLLVHIKEKNLSSNTALLAHRSLLNSEILFRGAKEQDLNDTSFLKEDFYPLYLYPTEDAVILDKELIQKINKPIQLIVPDGTWRQAKKVHKRINCLHNIQKVMLPKQSEKSIYELRKQKYEYGMCTLEAIAYAMRIVESEDCFNRLLKILKIKNERVKQSRALPYELI
jgi:DTW domain-containing protein YfiP